MREQQKESLIFFFPEDQKALIGLADRRLFYYNKVPRAVSSAVERFVYTEVVGGSNPSPPTKKQNGIASILLFCLWLSVQA